VPHDSRDVFCVTRDAVSHFTDDPSDDDQYVAWLQALPAGAEISWHSDHLSADRPWSGGWVDVLCPALQELVPSSWVWTITWGVPDDPDEDDGPGPLWDFEYPPDLCLYRVWEHDWNWGENFTGPDILTIATEIGTALTGEQSEQLNDVLASCSPDAGVYGLGGWSAECISSALEFWAEVHADLHGDGAVVFLPSRPPITLQEALPADVQSALRHWSSIMNFPEHDGHTDLVHAPTAGPPGLIARLDDLQRRAAGYASRRRAPATVLAYTSDFKMFARWGEAARRPVLPASPETIGLYLTDLAEWASPSTIARRLAAIAAVHDEAGLGTPTKDKWVRDVHAGIRRTRSTRPRGKDALLRDDIVAMIDAMPTDLRGLRDTALTLTLWVGAVRRSEVVRLTVDDLTWEGDGIVALVRRSKSDQEGHGREFALPRSRSPRYCPTVALRAWLDAANIDTGEVFRAVDKWGNISPRALCGHSVARIIQHRAHQAGLDHLDVSAHSTRVGFINQASLNADEEAVATQTGHRSIQVLRAYRRHARILDDTAARHLGL